MAGIERAACRESAAIIPDFQVNHILRAAERDPSASRVRMAHAVAEGLARNIQQLMLLERSQDREDGLLDCDVRGCLSGGGHRCGELLECPSKVCCGDVVLGQERNELPNIQDELI